MRSKRKLYAFAREHEFYLLLVVLAFALFLAVFTGGRFISLENLMDMLSGNAAMGIMAAGVLVVIISGGIDISFMATATVAQYIMALFILRVGGNMITAFLVPAAVGILLGCINALLVHHLKAPTIITTIATMNVFYGLLMWASNGSWLYGFPAWFSGQTPFMLVALPIGILIAVFAGTGLLLRHTTIGRRIFALGDNPEAAKRAGVNILRTRLFVYAFMGLTAALGSGVQAYIVQNVAPNSLMGREMEVLAIVVLGGASLTGGKGTILGTTLGLLLVAMLSNGLILLGISSYWHTFCMGAVILISFCLTGISALKRNKREVRI